MIETTHLKLIFSDNLQEMDWPQITSWLASSHWATGIIQQYVEKMARASTVVMGAFLDGQQIAYARVISDTVRFAYLVDVFVDEKYRKRGVAHQLISQLLEHPALSGVAHTLLLTSDAHGLYEKFGFVTHQNPQKIMIRSNKEALDYTVIPHEINRHET